MRQIIEAFVITLRKETPVVRSVWQSKFVIALRCLLKCSNQSLRSSQL